MQSDDLNSINAQTLPIPPVPQALGELIAEIAADQEPDAIVIDRISRTLIVYPRGSTTRSDEIESLSLTNLLSNYEVHMLEHEISDVAELLASEPPETHIALFHNPNTLRPEQCPSLKLISTKVLNPQFLILCCKTASDQSNYRLRGATILTQRTNIT